MPLRKRRRKVVAEITTDHLIKLMLEQGSVLDPQQAVNFLNEEGRAYVMWKLMMYAAESYIKSVLGENPQPGPNRLKLDASASTKPDDWQASSMTLPA